MRALARHLPNPQVRVVFGRLNWRKFQAKQPRRTSKCRLDHPVQLQIRLQRRLIQIMQLLAALFTIKPPVPRLQRPVPAIRMQHSFQGLSIMFRGRFCWRPNLHQQLAHSIRCARHFGFQLIIRETLIAQKLRPLGPQCQCFRRNRAIVGLARIGPARGPRLIGLLAQISALGKLQKRHNQGPRQGHNWPIRTFLLARRFGGRNHKIGQARQPVIIQWHDPVPLVGQQVLGKLRAQNRQPRFHVAQPVRRRAAQLRPRPHKPAPRQHQNPRLLVCKIQVITLVPQGLDPRKQCRIFRDPRPVSTQFRGEIPLQRLARRVTVGPRHGIKRAQNTAQNLFGHFQRRNRVGKIRRVGSLHNRCDICLCCF